MKNIICLLAAVALSIPALNATVTPAQNPDKKVEDGYKRPGTRQHKFTEDFLNGGKTDRDTETDDQTTPPRIDAPSAEVDDKGDKAPASVTYNSRNDIATLVKAACEYGIVIIRQPYGVIDEAGDFYGFENDNKELGATYTPAYAIRGGYLFTEPALTPWLFDTAYDEAKAELSTIRGSLIGETTSADLSEDAEYTPRTFNAALKGNVYPGLLYSMPDPSPLAKDGFYASSKTGDLEGYLVWIIKSPSQDLTKDTNLVITATRKPIKVEDDPAKLYDLGNGISNAIGALYLTPEVTGVGRVDFYLQGVGVQKDGTWSLIFPFTDPSKIFDAEQAVKAAAPEAPERKLTRLRKIDSPKADEAITPPPAEDTPANDRATATDSEQTDSDETVDVDTAATEPEL